MSCHTTIGAVRFAILGASLLLFSVLSVVPALSMPAIPFPLTLSQPDGSTIVARLKGDEYGNWYEAASGHTIVKDKKTNWWYYAVPSQRSGLEAGSYKVGQVDPRILGVQKSIRPSVSPLAAAQPPTEGALTDGPPDLPHVEKTLLILVDFTDMASTWDSLDFRGDFFGFGAGRSVADYFDKISEGQLTLVAAQETGGTADDGVVGWLSLNQTHPNCRLSGPCADTLGASALAAADSVVDFSAFDTNGDGDVKSDELALVFVVAGGDAALGDSTQSVWPHQGSFPENNTFDGKDIRNYLMIAEQQAGEPALGEPAGEHRATMGVSVHELGHLIVGFPDLYDVDYSSEGPYIYDIMAFGAFGRSVSDTYLGQTPTFPSAWSRQWAGFVTPDIVSSGSNVPFGAAAGGSPGILRIPTGNTHEYFLVENRHPTGYDLGLDTLMNLVDLKTGALVWHIDESFMNEGRTCYGWNNCNNSEAHKLVDLEEADGVQNLDTWTLAAPWTVTGLKDLFYSGGTTLFNDTTEPSSRFYSDRSNGVSLSGFSLPGSSMSVNVAGYVGEEVTPDNILGDPGFENGGSWSEYSSGGFSLVEADESAHGGAKWAYLGDRNNALDYIWQDLTVTPGAADAYMQFHYTIFTDETTDVAYDKLKVEVRRPSDGALLRSFNVLDNRDDTERPWNISEQIKLSDFVGDQIRIVFKVQTDEAAPTAFFLDDLALFSVMPGDDVVAPSTSLYTLPLSANGLSGWFNTVPYIYLRANEAVTTYYNWDLGSWSAYGSAFQGPSGTHKIYYYSEDTAGNEESESSRTFKIDAIDPTGGLIINGGAKYTRSRAVKLKITASDTGGSGLLAMRFLNNGGTWGAWKSYASSRDHTLSTGQGLKTVYVKLSDRAGNFSAASKDQIFFDSVDPKGKITVPPSATLRNGSVTIAAKWSGSDPSPASGVSKYAVQYRAPGSSAWNTVGSTWTTANIAYLRIPSRGTWYFRLKIMDKAGNVGLSASKYTVVR